MEGEYSLLSNPIDHPLLLEEVDGTEEDYPPQLNLLGPKDFQKQSKAKNSSGNGNGKNGTGFFGRQKKNTETIESSEGSPTKKSSPIEIKGSPTHHKNNKEKEGSNNLSSSRGKMSFLRAFTRRNSSQGKHKKMKWMEVTEPVLDGVTFCVKFLGSTLIDSEKTGASDAAEATKTVIQMSKIGHKPSRMGLTVSTSGITLSDPSTGEIREEISIYDIAHCSTDANYPSIFCFIATNKNDVNECYCFGTGKRKMAQHITLTIAQAFKLAFEIWQNESMNNCLSGVSINSADVDVIVGSSDSAKTNASTGSDIRDWVAFDQDTTTNDQEELVNRFNSIDLVTLSPFHRPPGDSTTTSPKKRNKQKPEKSAADDLLIFLN